MRSMKTFHSFVLMIVLICGTAFGQPNDTKPVILLLHGINSDHGTWDTFIRHIKSRPEFCYGGNWYKSIFGNFTLAQVDNSGNIGSHSILSMGPRECEASVIGNSLYGIYTMDFSSDNRLTFNQQGAEVKSVIEKMQDQLGERDIILMGHSMGGLAARAYIKNNPTNPICGLITIGTPHGGSYMAYTKDWLAQLDVTDLPFLDSIVSQLECALTDNALQCMYDSQLSKLENIERMLVILFKGFDFTSPAMDYLKPSHPGMRELQTQVFPVDIPVVLLVSNWEPDGPYEELKEKYTRYCFERYWNDFVDPNAGSSLLDGFSYELQQEFTDGVVSLPAQHLYLGISNAAEVTPVTMAPMSVFHTDETKMVRLLEDALNQLLSRISGTGEITMGFILDSSGSMSSNDPQDIRKTAMEIIVNQINPSNDVFIIDFDSGSDWINPHSWHNWNRDDLAGVIRTIDSSGGTNVGGGIQKLADVWDQNVLGSTNGGVLLLSDGMGDYSGQAMWFAGHGIPIYTISLVGEENGELLRLISSSTGGKYLKARTPADIIARFQEFYFALQSGNRIASFSSTIAQDQTMNYSFSVDQSIEDLMCNLSWFGSTVSMSLTDPAGNIYDHSTGQSWISGDAYVHTEIDNPMVGTWGVELFGQSIPQGQEPFQLEVYAKTDEVFSLELDTLRSSTDGGVIALDLETPVGGLNYTSIQQQALVVTPEADTLDVSDQISDMSVSFYPRGGIGTYEVSYQIEAILPGNEVVQRELYHSVFIGEIRPGNIDQVSIVISNLFVRAPLGSTRGNRIGLQFKAYKVMGQEPIASGYVTSVTPTECTLQIQQLLAPGKVEVGDFIELDPHYWRND